MWFGVFSHTMISYLSFYSLTAKTKCYLFFNCGFGNRISVFSQRFFFFFFCFLMGFSHLLLISEEEETRPCWHPDREKKCMLMYMVNKKTATVATKSSVLGDLTSWRSESLDCFGFGGCLIFPQRWGLLIELLVRLMSMLFFFPSIPSDSSW